MGLSHQVVEQLKKQCPELNQLPKDWTFNVTDDTRVSFVKISTRETTYNHPTLGGLPPPWILKIVRNADGRLCPMYYNRETRKQTKEDPRYMASTLALHSDHAPQELWIAASTTRNTAKMDMKSMKRTPIDYHKNIRDQYTKIWNIDPGDGSIGGMNGGVFVVTMKGLANRIFIEKRFKKDEVSFGKKEIQMMHRVNHPALTNYVAGFVLENANPPQASLYVEFCDRGSLEELIKAFVTRRNNGDRHAKVPEGFVWHALIGLVDGLAYLQSGVSFWRKHNARPDPSWVPILHRDVKPDNVLLRSRATLGSNKYFYCVLSDFGLACEDRDDSHHDADKYQVARVKLGTKAFWAPELCYNPYPRSYRGSEGEKEWRMFPNENRHSRYSDVWALGASVYNLCALGTTPNALSHLNLAPVPYIPGMTNDKYLEGTECREQLLAIPSPPYSEPLRKAILLATKWEHRERPSPVKLIQALGPLVDVSGFANQGSKHELLPDWATKAHEYLSRAEKINKSNAK